jgi:hypothetical protein
MVRLVHTFRVNFSATTFAAAICLAASSLMPLHDGFAQQCPSGCLKGRKGSLVVPPKGAIGIRSSRQFIERQNARAFRRAAEARGAGYTDYVPPTATPTPTPTTTPAIPAYQGRYVTDNDALLAATTSTAPCNPTVFPQATAVAMELLVFHEADSNLVRAEEPSTYPTPSGTPTPTPPGARYWGGANSSGFSVSDTFPSSDSCTNPIRNRTFAFSQIDAESAQVTRTDRVVCQGNNPVIDCEQVWTGSAIRDQ